MSASPTWLSARQGPPNIIIILADDLGYGDLGCYGSPSIRTPELDRMASEGLRFTDFYAGGNLCTPSPAAMLTGRLAIRSGVAGRRGKHVFHPGTSGGLPAQETTIAEALKPKGYATALIGKWHLGHILPENLPMAHGFDYYFGLPYSNDMKRVSPEIQNPLPLMSMDHNFRDFRVPLMRGTEVIELPADQSTLTRRYTEEAVQFIKDKSEQPFFLYIAHTFPHTPLFVSENFRGKSLRGRYGDTVEELDWSVGRVLAVLREKSLDSNTLVFFTSDNGPMLNQKWTSGSAGPFRDGKASTWEGAYRVPGIAWWPAKFKQGVTSELASMLDLFNTALELGGAPLPAGVPLDGVDMAPILFERHTSKRVVQLYYYGDQLQALRKGPFKIHFVTNTGYGSPPVRQDPPLLFNLNLDPGESYNVATEYPDVVAELARLARDHETTVTRGDRQF